MKTVLLLAMLATTVLCRGGESELIREFGTHAPAPGVTVALKPEEGEAVDKQVSFDEIVSGAIGAGEIDAALPGGKFTF